MVKQPANDRPLAERGNDVGPIGVRSDSTEARDFRANPLDPIATAVAVPEEQVVSAEGISLPQPNYEAAPLDASTPDPDAFGSKVGARTMELVRPAADPEIVLGPLDAFDSPGFKAANEAARGSFDNVLILPGHVFTAIGRYFNIRNLDDVYDVRPGQIVPDGLHLIPERYLLDEPFRSRALQQANR